MKRGESIQDIKLVDFPEEIDGQNGIKLYGETSWENQLAVLSHYLHNNGSVGEEKNKKEAIYAIREFLEKKENGKEEITDEYIASPHNTTSSPNSSTCLSPTQKSPNSHSSTYLPTWAASVLPCRHRVASVCSRRSGTNM